jgi:predicted nucleic acid-binding protein
MKRFVLDCSVAAPWCFADENNAYVDAVLEDFSAGYEALVPPLWVLEVINVLTLAERRKRLLPAETEHFFELYSSLPIRLDQALSTVSLHSELMALCRSQNLTAYDTAYLQTAIRHGIPLATQNEALRTACRQCGVMVFASAA